MAIQPVILLSALVVHGLAALRSLKASGQHPAVPGDLSIDAVFRQFGAERWDRLRVEAAQH